MEIEEYFSETGILSKNINHFEPRHQQLLMAKEVESSLENNGIAVIEAGTGVGKSLAYLIPSVLWSVKEGTRIVVSTYSKTLQQQLMDKELPFLRDKLKIPFEYAMAMGTGNYLCHRRLGIFLHNDRFQSKKEARQVSKISSWANKTKTGLKQELDFEVLPEIWNKICRESDLCFRGKCQISSECPFMRERAVLRKANVIVVNHHLFFAHISSGESILPPFKAIVFDEAHCLEEVALHHFGISVSPNQIKFLADNIFNPSTGRGFLTRIPQGYDFNRETLKMILEDLRANSDMFFQNALLLFSDKKLPFRINESNWIINTLSPILRKFARELKHIKDLIDDDDTLRSEFDAYIRRAREFATNLDILIKQDQKDYVYWLESFKSNKISLNGASINVGDILSKILFSGFSPVVLASATLTADNQFDFLKKSLGISDSSDLLLDSPFDYRNNALIYIASDLPDPSNKNLDFENVSSVRIKELAEISAGACLALFTSYRHMNLAYDSLLELDCELNIMKQGDMPQAKLLEQFRMTPNSLLLATNSFWQGIDIPGEELRMVILVKLPFSVPDEPLTEARAEYCEDNGGNPFMDLHLPQAIIWMKQGFGRLIRSAYDRGVVAILDKRVMTKFYGKKFLTSLPKTLYTSRLADVKSFLEDGQYE